MTILRNNESSLHSNAICAQCFAEIGKTFGIECCVQSQEFAIGLQTKGHYRVFLLDTENVTINKLDLNNRGYEWLLVSQK